MGFFSRLFGKKPKEEEKKEVIVKPEVEFETNGLVAPSNFSNQKYDELGEIAKKAQYFESVDDFENAISENENFYQYVLENKKHFSIYHIAHQFERLMILYRKYAPEMEKPFIVDCIRNFEQMADEKTLKKWKIRLNKLTVKDKDTRIVVEEYTPNEITLNQKIEFIKRKCEPFDFYEQDQDRAGYGSMVYNGIISEQLPLLDKYHELKQILDDLILKGEFEESKKNYGQAIKYYEIAVGEESFLTKPYERLMVIYRKLKRKDDEINLIERAIDNLTKLRESQKEFLYSIANTKFRKQKTDEYINNNQKIFYYSGVFELYNPYPIIKKWEDRLQKLKK